MNTSRFMFVLGVVIASGLVATVISARNLNHARSAYEAAQGSFQSTVQDAQEVAALRAKHERVSLRQRPTQDVIAQVNTILAEVGIPGQHLKSLAPESDTAIPAGGVHVGGYKKQSLRLVLENLSVEEIGRFLIAGKESQQVWTATRLELVHVRGQDLYDGRYDVTILLTAIYIEEPDGA